MAKHYRKSHRHHKRRHSRKTHRKQQQRKQQRGGSGCAYQAQNRQAFQMGGMAPFVAGDAYLLDAATRVQAEVAPLDKSFAELPSVIPHRGGARRSHKQRQSRRHKQRQSRSQKQRQSRSHKQRQSRSQKQRGGMAPFEASYTTGVAHQAQNDQFATEGTVNSLYHENKGPQGF